MSSTLNFSFLVLFEIGVQCLKYNLVNSQQLFSFVLYLEETIR
uniref:Uncharacterized protein n=1 Tax=Rhizophora mucronata TaxID=61149 RepID=A0A2P2PQY7_RHIMU